MSAPLEGVVHRQHTLENGLVISAEIDPQAVSAACGFFVDTGARDEPSHLMGVTFVTRPSPNLHSIRI